MAATSTTLPPPKTGSLRQAASACVQRLQADPALQVNIQHVKKRPLNLTTALSPCNTSPLAQGMRSDFQIGESEVESPERELLRSQPSHENSPSPVSPCLKGLPSPAPLVFTPSKEKSSCLNCDAEMTPHHQCDAFDSDINCNWENESKTEVEVQQVPLPLCHYCCHRGSDEHPVHFYTVCICSDDKCTCRCYCDEDQFLLKKQIFPSGLGSKRAVGLEGRALARATALASPWVDSKPCERTDCCVKCKYDTPCSKY